MKRPNYKSVFRSVLVLILVIFAWMIGIFITYNFLVLPIAKFLLSSEVMKLLIAILLSWLLMSMLFELIFERV